MPGAVRTAAFHISPQGYVAGRYLTGTDSPFHSFVWKDGAFEYFDVPDAYSTLANGINALGEVTGRFYDAPDPECTDPPARGFVRTKGGEFLEITLSGAVNLTVNQMTASGMMVVDSLDADCWPGDNIAGFEHGYLLKRGSSYQIDYPGSTWTDARSISERGDIVGVYADSEDRGHGFLLKNGEFSTVDYPGAEGTDINDINLAGEMVGIAWNVAPEGRDVSFLLRAGNFIEIQYPGAVKTRVWGLNDAGTVCGFWQAADGIWRSFVAKRH